MDQDEALAKVAAKARSRPSNIAGIFVILIGLLTLIITTGGYFASLSPAVYSVNKVSLTVCIWGTIIGIALLLLGHKMVRLTRKITQDDVAARIDKPYFVTLLSKSRKELVAPTRQAVTTISPEGLHVVFDQPEQPVIDIAWHKIQAAQWRCIYNRDAYEIETDDSVILFAHNDPLNSQQEARAYWTAGIAAPEGVETAQAFSIVGANMVDIYNLTPIHIYLRFYNERVAPRWLNYTDMLFFGNLFYAVTIITLTVWAYTLTEGLGGGVRLQITFFFIGLATGTAAFLLRHNIELRLSQVVTRTKHF